MRRDKGLVRLLHKAAGAVAEALQQIEEADPPTLNIIFPASYNYGSAPDDGLGGPAVSDCGAMYMVDELENVLGKTTLNDVVEEMIDLSIRVYAEEGEAMPIDQRERFLGICQALRAAADKLEASLGGA